MDPKPDSHCHHWRYFGVVLDQVGLGRHEFEIKSTTRGFHRSARSRLTSGHSALQGNARRGRIRRPSRCAIRHRPRWRAHQFT